MELGKQSFKDKALDFFYSKWFKLIWGIIFVVGLPFVYNNYQKTNGTIHALAIGMCIIGGIYCIFSFLKSWLIDRENKKEKVF